MASPQAADARGDAGAAPPLVGFVGLGRMGYPMAGHIAGAKRPLMAFDVRRDTVEEFCRAAGAQPAHSLAELGAGCDVVVTMLPTSREVRAVLVGDDAGGGLVDVLAPGSLVIDCSSSDPMETRALGEILAQRSIAMVDAPVAGGVVFARDGSLDILLGGADEARERARAVLEPTAGRFFDCGALGAGHAMKVLNNFVNAQALLTYAEAMAAGLKFGLAPDMMVESLVAATTGRNHPFEKKIVAQVLPRRFATGMALSLIAKDVGLARDLAQGLGMQAPVLNACLDLWTRAAEEIGPMADQSEVVKLWERDAGVELARN